MSKTPLHNLPGFIAAARLGNLSRAAAALHLTVSALSHQMAGLEQHLGCKLFERKARGLVLTDAGDELFKAVAPHYDMLERALNPDRDRSDQSLTLSVMPSVASSWLLPRLASFVAAYPQIELSLQSTSDLVDFDREAVDAAIRLGRGHWPGLHSELLFDEWVFPVASPELLARFPGADRETLAGLPLLFHTGDRWREWFELAGGSVPRCYVASFSTTETLHRAAAEGLGVALGRLTMARPLIDSGTLVALSTRRLRADYAHYLVYPARSERHPALLSFRTWVLAAAAAYGRDADERPVRKPKPRARRS